MDESSEFMCRLFVRQMNVFTDSDIKEETFYPKLYLLERQEVDFKNQQYSISEQRLNRQN